MLCVIPDDFTCRCGPSGSTGVNVSTTIEIAGQNLYMPVCKVMPAEEASFELQYDHSTVLLMLRVFSESLGMSRGWDP